MNYDFRLADEYEPFFSISYDEFCERFYQEKAEEECMKMLFPEEEETFEEVDAIAMELEEDFPQKDLTRGKRRKKDYAKAIRKERIANAVYPGGFNAPHGYYRKGKIHCSCPMCSAKTNDRNNKSNGPVDGSGRRGTRLAGTHRRYGRKNYKPSDMRKIDHMRDELIAFI